MRLRSSSSRKGSPSHQIAKLAARGWPPGIAWPRASYSSREFDAQASSPAWRGSISALTPRPVSLSAGVVHSRSPVRASSIAAPHVAVARDILVHPEFFQPRPGRIEIADMHGVAVAQAAAPQALAVIVERHRSVDHLVAAVAIDIGDGELVIALTAETLIARRRAVEQPAPGQLAVTPVPGGDGRSGIIAAAEHQARPLAVQIGDAGQDTGRSGCHSRRPTARCAPRSSRGPRGGA